MSVEPPLHRSGQTELYTREDRLVQCWGSDFFEPCLECEPAIKGPVVHDAKDSRLGLVQRVDHLID